MKHTIPLACAAFALAFNASCALEDEPTLGSNQSGPSYEEFEAAVYVDSEGMPIVNGDEPAYGDELFELWAALYGGDELAIANVGGVDIRWPAADAKDLTYCVDKKSFGGNYAKVVSAMKKAGKQWKKAAKGKVAFRHVKNLDGRCKKNTQQVVFNVTQVKNQPYLASAFFPSYPRNQRQLKIDTSSFGDLGPITLTGVLRHELGHALGFRHEHTRPEAGTCFEDAHWRGVTRYDPRSVMHYPQCNGAQQGDLVLTNLDKQGVRAIYQ